MNSKNWTVAALIVGRICLAQGADYEILGTNSEGVVSIAVNGAAEAHVTETFSAPDVSRLVIARGLTRDVCYLEPADGDNTFAGGIVLTNCQLRYNGPSVSHCFGLGPIVFGDVAGAFYAQKDADVNNKLVVMPDVWLASDGKCRLTLRDVGFAPANEDHVLALGRAGADGVSVNVLSLTNENCEAIGQIWLRGQLDLTIENRLPVGGQCRDLFVRYAGHSTGTSDVHVSTGGVTFAVASGADVAVGVPLRTDAGGIVTNVLETVQAYNWSFESGSEGWSASADENPSAPPGCQDSPNSSWCTYVTPYGCKVMMLRWGNKFSTSDDHPVTLPRDGKWRVAFVCASRNVNGTGGLNPITVTVDKGTATEVSVVVPARITEKHDYLEVVTEPMELTAGEHHLQFVTGTVQTGNAGTGFDAIRFERIECSPIPDGTIAKNGSGKLTMSAVTSSGKILAEEGMLALEAPQVSKTATVAVESGAGLQLLDDEIANLVSNCSFQDDGDTYRNLVPMTVSGWAWTITTPRGDVNSSGNGLQGNGGNCSLKAPWTMYGNVTAFMRECTSFTQSVDVPADGEYTLSFIEAYRSGYDEAKGIVYTVKIGETLVISGHPTSSSVFTRHVKTVNLRKGRYDLVIHYGDDSLASAVGRQGAVMFLDDIRLAPDDQVFQNRLSVLELSHGASLSLDNAYPCVLDRITVDGQKVRVRVSDLRAAGVTVSGLGKIKSSNPPGLLVIVS